MKILAIILSLVLLSGCSGVEKKQKPTPKEQVAGLAKMCGEAASDIKKRQAQKSLYERLGKKERIKEFSAKLYASHKANKDIGHMFKHVEAGPFIDNVTKFLVAGTGGGTQYKGKSMKAVHRNMKISHADFLAAGGDVQNVMKGMNYGENEIQEVVCALVSFVPVVVTR